MTPAVRAPLLARHPRVVATPHVGWHTSYMFRQTSEAFAANLRRYEAGDDLLWTVNAPLVRRKPDAPDAERPDERAS